MKFVRRVLFALGIAGIVSAGLRLRGSGGVPQRQGGWREVTPRR